LPDLFAASPVLLSARVKATGGTLVVRGRTDDGTWTKTLQLKPVPLGEGSPAVAATFARERVEDLEVQAAAGHGGSDVDAEITKLGLQFQISTRLTSWVAVGEEVAVDPADPTRNEVMPQSLPYGMSVTGLGLRESFGGAPAAPGAPAPRMATLGMSPAAPMQAPPAPKGRGGGGIVKKVADAFGGLVGRRRKQKAGPGSSGGEFSRSAPPPPPAAAPRRPEPAPAKEEADGFAADLDDEMPEEQLQGGGAGFREFEGQYEESTEAAARFMAGRLTILGDRWIVDIDIGDNLDWDLPEAVELELEDGRTLTVKLRSSESTRSGKVLSGARVRLSLEPDASESSPNVRAATFETPDGTTWRIDLSRG
jgi:Ca-activated chloride channel family protein